MLFERSKTCQEALASASLNARWKALQFEYKKPAVEHALKIKICKRYIIIQFLYSTRVIPPLCISSASQPHAVQCEILN